MPDESVPPIPFPLTRGKRSRPRIVTLGAGTGHAALLRGLAARPVELTAIVGVTDNGGHTGVLRERLGGPALGDARHCLEALVDGDPWRTLLSTRFTSGPLKGASAGNLLMHTLTRQYGTLSAALERLRASLGIRARILPVSNDAAQVVAVLENGRRVRGEWNIIQRTPRLRIREVRHEPELRLLPEARRAIAEADLIVIAPGALWTALGAVLTTQGMRAALRRTRAPKVWVANILSQPTQLGSASIEDHVRVMSDLVGGALDAVLVNTRKPAPGLLRRYATEGSRWIAPPLSLSPGGERAGVRGAGPHAPLPIGVGRASRPSRSEQYRDRQGAAQPGPRLIRGDFLERPTAAHLRAYDRHASPAMAAAPHWIRHDGRRIADTLLKILRNGKT